MQKKYLKTASFVLQGIYSAACIFDILLCLIYYNGFETALGSQCADWALVLTGILFFVPAMPVGFVFNMMAMPPRQSEQTERRRWLIWTILSPIIYLVFCFIVICVFIATTGGI